MRWLFLFLSLGLCAAAPPVIIAHRGASGYLPEHTLEAVAMAHAMGADFIEQDVVLSRDGAPVVLHDIHLDDVTDAEERFPDRKRDDGRWYALDFTLAELKTLRAHERVDRKTGRQVYPGRFPHDAGSFRIPTLEEELALIRGLNHSTGRSAGLYVELKQPAWHRKQGHDLSAVVLEVLRRHGFRTRADACWLQCFEWAEVQRLRTELRWEGRLLWLTSGPKKDAPEDPRFTAAGLKELAAVADGIGPALGAVVEGKRGSPRHIAPWIAHAKAAGLELHAWTLRTDELPAWATTPDDVLTAILKEAHATGLFTDFPDIAVHWRNAHP